MACNKFIEIDGSVMEGGGQILRIATSLSAILKIPMRVKNIRAGRKTPGLRAQHLTGLELVRKICNGQLTGGNIGSTEIEFSPGIINSGSYTAEISTAGSIVLLLQVAFPCLLFADGPTELILKGGTNAEMAPQVDYTSLVFKPTVEKMGAKFDITVIKRGYFPKGGGKVMAKIYPVENAISALNLSNRGAVFKNITGYSYVAGALPIKVAHLMADEVKKCLRSTVAGTPFNIERVKEAPEAAIGTSNGIVVVAETESGCKLAGSALGRRGISAEKVGQTAAISLMEELKHGGCVDQHMQDQLIILMALALGTSHVECGPITLHTQTAIHVTKLLTDAKFTVTENTGSKCSIECEGIGWTANSHL